MALYKSVHVSKVFFTHTCTDENSNSKLFLPPPGNSTHTFVSSTYVLYTEHPVYCPSCSSPSPCSSSTRQNSWSWLATKQWLLTPKFILAQTCPHSLCRVGTMGSGCQGTTVQSQMSSNKLCQTLSNCSIYILLYTHYKSVVC